MEAGRPAASVSYQQVTKRYPGQEEPAINGLSLEVEAGEICVLVGPSGSGKTTALRMVNRTVEITEGDILIGDTSVRDRDPAELRREMGYVIQQIGLFPHRTVVQNIETVPRLLGWDRAQARDRADELLDLIGLDRAPARPLPEPALRRAAAARRGGAGARRGSAGDADGRALRRDRSDQPGAAAERVPPAPDRDPQDGPLRHPRHRRGDQDGRPDRDHRGGQAGWPSTRPRRSC